MIFLAVFLGFFAENIREHKADKERLFREMHTMIGTLKHDINRYGEVLWENATVCKGLDSFRYQIDEAIAGRINANKPLYMAFQRFNNNFNELPAYYEGQKAFVLTPKRHNSRKYTFTRTEITLPVSKAEDNLLKETIAVQVSPADIQTINVKRNVTEHDEVLLVCGIANPKPLKHYLALTAGTYYQIDYRDHHIFTIDDLTDIIQRYRSIHAESKFILTTEKDSVRLSKFKQQLTELPLYVLPIRHRFLFNEESGFNNLIFNYIANFKVKIAS
ncbi:MAG: hypothetical protein EOP48_34320 [Sphingobacteriales bacterium]|nr:MAG: hypothetical protein EOP48_34320 [Sphingobacteriales bacterium]